MIYLLVFSNNGCVNHRQYLCGIHNYFNYHITNLGGEGFNTKINIIRRKAYGFWDL